MPGVLFLCVHNAGRSQMAAAFARALSWRGLMVLSGGSAPAEAVHPGVVGVMSEIGIDLAAEVPRQFEPGMLRLVDVVVTMGCGDACPVLPGLEYHDWPVDDPAGRPLEEVRRIRDEIRRRVMDLLATLRPSQE